MATDFAVVTGSVGPGSSATVTVVEAQAPSPPGVPVP